MGVMQRIKELGSESEQEEEVLRCAASQLVGSPGWAVRADRPTWHLDAVRQKLCNLNRF